MSKQALTRASVPQQTPVGQPGDDGTGSGTGRDARPSPLAVLPAAFVVLFLVLATWWHGAFQARDWAPPALFSLIVLAVLTAAGAIRRLSRPAALVLVGIWGLAALSLASMAWSQSPGGAWQGGNLILLYAALVSIGLIAVPGRMEARLVGRALVIGVGLIALATLIRLDVHGQPLFLAGRLDGPVGYRNATAALFGVGFWPFVSVAAQRGAKRLLRASAMGGAVLVLGLVVLTQSRGAVLGLVVGGAIALALGPERVRRAWTALLAVGVVAAISSRLLAPYHAFEANESIGVAHVGAAAGALTAAAATAFVAGFILALLDNGLRASSPRMGQARTLARAGLVALAIAAPVAGVAAMGNPVHYARAKYDDFRSLDTTLGTTRLTETGGQRYDLWRIAWHQFEDDPIAGAGVGSYPSRYYLDRATDRNLTNPHSLLFDLLAETGVVGTSLFLVFLGGLAAVVLRGARSASRSDRRLAGALAAAGAVVVVQLLVDWTWLIPGTTGIGLLALALAAALVDRPPQARPARPRARRVLRAASAACLVAAAAGVLATLVSDFELRRARAEAGRSAAAQLSSARMARRLDPLALPPRYQEASALESEGRVAAARAALHSALDMEPRNFATLTLIGDLEARAGRRAVAIRWYRRASALNPRDVGLLKLARGQFAG